MRQVPLWRLMHRSLIGGPPPRPQLLAASRRPGLPPMD
jgi:hypothetical protein